MKAKTGIILSKTTTESRPARFVTTSGQRIDEFQRSRRSGELLLHVVRTINHTVGQLNHRIESLEKTVRLIIEAGHVAPKPRPRQQTQNHFSTGKSAEAVIIETTQIFARISRLPLSPKRRVEAERNALFEELKEIVTNHDYDLILPVPGEPFDPSKHQVLKTDSAPRTSLARTIAETYQPGIQAKDGRIVETARVRVFTNSKNN